MKPERKGWKVLPPVVITRYWLVQGAMYMNWVERLHRWSLELVLFALLYTTCLFPCTPAGMAVMFIISHTVSMLGNGHLYAMLSHDLFWYAAYEDRERFMAYVDTMYARLQKKQPDYVRGVVFYGSLTRGVFRKTSDLDVRFIAREGVWNALRTAQLVFVERFHALLARFPIDAYMFRSKEEVECKMDVVYETPVALYATAAFRDIADNVIDYRDFRAGFTGGAKQA